jgi:type II secretory pathway component PulJ
MSQNMISLTFSAQQLAEVDQALTQLENALSGLISLDADERRSLNRMGNKSEVFCRRTVAVLEQNPQMVPAALDLAAARADLETLDRLRPRLDRLQRLAERGTDTEIALGSDVMELALEGYALLKVSGRNQGLDGLRRELSSRFARSRRSAGPQPA